MLAMGREKKKHICLQKMFVQLKHPSASEVVKGWKVSAVNKADGWIKEVEYRWWTERDKKKRQETGEEQRQ